MHHVVGGVRAGDAQIEHGDLRLLDRAISAIDPHGSPGPQPPRLSAACLGHRLLRMRSRRRGGRTQAGRSPRRANQRCTRGSIVISPSPDAAPSDRYAALTARAAIGRSVTSDGSPGWCVRASGVSMGERPRSLLIKTAADAGGAHMEAELNPAQRLHALGQSLWLDSINRVMLRTGALARYVRELAVTGLTSNPTILGHAMAAGSDYDGSLTRLAGEGVTGAQDLVYALALEDLAEAAALFRPEWEQSGGVDGYVSLEVPPDVAYDAAATVALARRLHDQAGFPNLLVKIPGTPPGLTAMEEAITAGVGVNVTLLFSDSHYLRTADAYLRALERRHRDGLDLAVPSVASVFISRWDAAADPLLPPALHGSLGPAMAQKTYASHVQLLADQRWQALAQAGALPQRVLWASTSTKNPDLPDTYYLGRLAAPDTIDTVPEKTLLAFADHGSLDERLEPDYAAAERAISAAADAGLDADALAERLQRHGAGAFTADWAALLTAIDDKTAKPTT